MPKFFRKNRRDKGKPPPEKIDEEFKVKTIKFESISTPKSPTISPDKPDETEIERLFDEFLASHIPKAEAREKMKRLPIGQKWELIQGSRKQEHSTADRVEEWLSMFAGPITSEMIDDLNVELGSCAKESLEVFLMRDGLNRLLEFLTVLDLNPPPNVAALKVATLKCVHSCIDFPAGIQNFIKNPDATRRLLHGFQEDSVESMHIVFKLLVCYILFKQDYRTVLDSLDLYRIFRRGKCRFDPLVTFLTATQNVENMLMAFIFINTLMSVIDSPSMKAILYKELDELSFKNAISRCKSRAKRALKGFPQLDSSEFQQIAIESRWIAMSWDNVLKQHKQFVRGRRKDREDERMLRKLKVDSENPHSAYERLFEMMEGDPDFTLFVKSIQNILLVKQHAPITTSSLFWKALQEFTEVLTLKAEELGSSKASESTEESRILHVGTLGAYTEAFDFYQLPRPTDSENPETSYFETTSGPVFMTKSLFDELIQLQKKTVPSLKAQIEKLKQGSSALSQKHLPPITPTLPLPPIGEKSLQPPSMGGSSLQPPSVGGSSLQPPSVGGSSLQPPSVGGSGLAPPSGPLAAPAPPKPVIPKKKNEKPKVPMKSLNWDRIPETKVKGTLWEKFGRDDRPIQTRYFEKLFTNIIPSFSQAAPSKAAPGAAPSGSRPKKVSLIDSTRSRSFAIVLSRVRLPLSEVRRAILELDHKKIPPEQLESMVKEATPDSAEIEKVKTHIEENPKDQKRLAMPEEYVLTVADIPRLKVRLRNWCFAATFAQQIDLVSVELETVSLAFNVLKASQRFQHFLSITLAVGNFMNGGTRRGGAWGFRLRSLKTLASCRDVENKRTLLHALLNYTADLDRKWARDHPAEAQKWEKKEKLLKQNGVKDLQSRAVLRGALGGKWPINGFITEFAALTEASKIGIPELFSEFRKSRTQFASIERTLERTGSNIPGDRYRPKMSRFVSKYKALVDNVTTLNESVDTVYKECVEQFGEVPSALPPQDAIEAVAEFIPLCHKALLENEKDKEEKEQEERRKKLRIAAETRSTRSSRQMPKPRVSARASARASTRTSSRMKSTNLDDLISKEALSPTAGMASPGAAEGQGLLDDLMSALMNPGAFKTLKRRRQSGAPGASK